MNIKVKEIENKLEKESVSREVLYDLQEWFGMPESTEEYIQDSQEKPFLACYINDKLVGFIVLNATSKDCAEIFGQCQEFCVNSTSCQSSYQSNNICFSTKSKYYWISNFSCRS